MSKIARIVSGGQTGVDRAALDTAKAYGLETGGWCPRGGLAEDCPDPPGVLTLYPELKETPSRDVNQRTVRNVRDADATLLIYPANAASGGTDLTEQTAVRLNKPFLRVTGEKSAAEVVRWLEALGDDLTLNVAGPRESECPGVYQAARSLLERVFEEVGACQML